MKANYIPLIVGLLVFPTSINLFEANLKSILNPNIFNVECSILKLKIILYFLFFYLT